MRKLLYDYLRTLVQYLLFFIIRGMLPPNAIDTRNLKPDLWGFPGGAVVGSLPANAGDTGSSPGLGRSHMLRSN